MPMTAPIKRRIAPKERIIVVAPHPRTGVWREWIIPVKNVKYPDGVRIEDVGAFPPKQVIGDWKESDHEILSFMTQNSWAGGGQLHESEETQTIDRFNAIASLDTRFPNALYLLPLTIEIEGPNTTNCRVLGDMVVSNIKQTFAAFDDKICSLSGSFPTIVASAAIATLTDPIPDYAKPVLFKQGANLRMYIPQGDQGYQVFSGTSLDAQVTTIKPERFMVFSRKLWAIDANGILWKSLDGTNWVDVVELDPGYEVRGLGVYLDRYDAPAPYIITDQMAFAFDENVPALYPTELKFGPHRYSGVASEVWRTDLYTAIGMGVQRYTVGTVDPVGLDRNSGCGPEFTGYISSLCGGVNDLFGGVSSTLATGTTQEEAVVDQGDELYFGQSTAKCHVQRLNSSRNWHTLWIAPTAGGMISDITISTARSETNVLWGWKGRLYASLLPEGFDNPDENPTKYFMPDGELTSSWFDMAMKASRKTAAAFELRAGRIADELNFFRLQYQIDNDDVSDTWHDLGAVSAPGDINTFQLGENGTFPAQRGLAVRPAYYGVGLNRIRYRLKAQRDPDDVSMSPILKSLVLDYFKTGRTVRSIYFDVDCSNPEFNRRLGLTNAERRELFRSINRSDGFFPMLINTEWLMIKPAYAQGPEMTGSDDRGDVAFSGVESFDARQIRQT